MLKEFRDVKVNYVGEALIKEKDKLYKIPGCINGEDILVEMDGKYPKLSKIIKPSKYRINDGCPYQKLCGGCQFMHMDYNYELEQKKKHINELFKNVKGVSNIEILTASNHYNYRNKSQMTYIPNKNRKVVCGFYEEHSHRLVEINNCMLQAKPANNVINELNKILTKNKIEVYDERTRRGVIRHVFVRYGFNTNELMLILVTNGEMFPGRNNVIKDLLKLNLGITTIIQNINTRDTSIVLGDKNKILYGPGYIYEKVGDFKFKISPNSFFQVNTVGMEKLYNKALELAEIKKTDIVIDAYCGVGTISIFASKFAKEVIGVELNKQAIMDANINAKLNNIKNIHFIADDATNFITHAAKDKAKFDILIMDPPREGSTKQFINAVGYLKPRKVVYVSCDPNTLKRDLDYFKDNNYDVKKITCFEMFAKTSHVECVVLLNRIEPKK